MASENELLNPHNWVIAYADYLYRFAVIRINDEEQARDLVQETFLAALEKINSFQGKSNEKTWLTAILKNKIIDVYRKRGSGFDSMPVNKAEKEQQDFFDSDNGHWISEYAPQPIAFEQPDALANKEFNQVLQQCLQKLPTLWMAVFTMKHIDDADTNTICNELRVTPANFWVIIHRAKINLRACLQKNWI